MHGHRLIDRTFSQGPIEARSLSQLYEHIFYNDDAHIRNFLTCLGFCKEIILISMTVECLFCSCPEDTPVYPHLMVMFSSVYRQCIHWGYDLFNVDADKSEKLTKTASEKIDDYKYIYASSFIRFTAYIAETLHPQAGLYLIDSIMNSKVEGNSNYSRISSVRTHIDVQDNERDVTSELDRIMFDKINPRQWMSVYVLVYIFWSTIIDTINVPANDSTNRASNGRKTVLDLSQNIFEHFQQYSFEAKDIHLYTLKIKYLPFVSQLKFSTALEFCIDLTYHLLHRCDFLGASASDNWTTLMQNETEKADDTHNSNGYIYSCDENVKMSRLSYLEYCNIVFKKSVYLIKFIQTETDTIDHAKSLKALSQSLLIYLFDTTYSDCGRIKYHLNDEELRSASRDFMMTQFSDCMSSISLDGTYQINYMMVLANLTTFYLYQCFEIVYANVYIDLNDDESINTKYKIDFMICECLHKTIQAHRQDNSNFCDMGDILGLFISFYNKDTTNIN